jgi:hypothetical protein
MGDPERQAKRAERRRRLLQIIKLPMVSGKAMAAVLILCFLMTGLLVPIILRKEAWIDAEFVVGTWWLIWVIVLSAMLYQGHRVSDDHQLGEARSWGLRNMFKGWYSSGSSIDAVDVFVWDSEALAIGCLIILALPLLVGLIWLLVEIAVPALIFVAYFLVRGQLAHVVNDKHRCKGNLLRAVAWGALWATVYTAPLAGLVWFVYFAARRVAL